MDGASGAGVVAGIDTGLGRADDDDRVRFRLTTEAAEAGRNSCRNDNLFKNSSGFHRKSIFLSQSDTRTKKMYVHRIHSRSLADFTT